LIASFASSELRDCCASLEKATAAIGSEHAQQLITLLSEAEAAETAAELMDLYGPHVTADGDTLSLPVGTQYRVRFVAIGSKIVCTPEGAPDWATVRRLKLMELVAC
jgi:hypothetical protein